MSAGLLALLLLAAPQPPPAAAACGPDAWPLWKSYARRFISDDGRVVDRGAGDRTTSEGQAYGLFFALAAGDRPRFDRLLGWTRDNLARADLARHLPSWLWGRRRNGSWGVLDDNAASDADLWMAYALLEAGRLWRAPAYAELGRKLAGNLAAREVRDARGLGPVLLPGPRGFVLEKGRALRLNLSYLPPQLLRRLASLGVPGPWSELLRSTARILREGAPRGVAADWVLYRAGAGFGPDPQHGNLGSYDAIRVPLWVGMLSPQDPLRSELLPAVRGLLELTASKGLVPERVDTRALSAQGEGPVGFAAALLPLSRAAGDARTGARLQARLAAANRDGLYGDPPAYYDQNLALFGVGFDEGRFRFAEDGSLVPAWEAACASAR